MNARHICAAVIVAALFTSIVATTFPDHVEVTGFGGPGSVGNSIPISINYSAQLAAPSGLTSVFLRSQDNFLVTTGGRTLYFVPAEGDVGLFSLDEDPPFLSPGLVTFDPLTGLITGAPFAINVEDGIYDLGASGVLDIVVSDHLGHTSSMQIPYLIPPFAESDTTTTNTNPGDPLCGVPDGMVNGGDLSHSVEKWLLHE